MAMKPSICGIPMVRCVSGRTISDMKLMDANPHIITDTVWT